MKIKTDYWAKPMPIRSFDWCAFDENTHDVGAPIGYGATEQEALKDLLAQIELSDDDYEHGAEHAQRIRDAAEGFDNE